MRETSLGNVRNCSASFARSQAKVDILKAVDERFVETTAIEEPIPARDHGGAGDAQRITRSGDALER